MPGPGEVPAQQPARIIGREAELARLRGLVDRVPQASQVLLITGQAGMGKTVWIAPASLEAAMSANCLLSYQIPVPHNGFPRTLSAAYRRSMSEAYPHYTRIPSPSWRASHHRLPAIPS